MAEEVELSVVVRSQYFSCSGIILNANPGIILTVGSIANGFVLKSDYELLKKTSKLRQNFDNLPQLQVIVKQTDTKRISSKSSFLSLNGHIIALWRDAELYELQKKIFPEREWIFENGKMDANEKLEKSKSSETEKQENSISGLADFALVEVKELANYSVKNIYLTDTKAQTGDVVSVIGTPFGSECYSIFFNSSSKGIVSNVIGPHHQMILTDARCVPGCEGCPVFIVSKTQMDLYGIVVAPFCWRSGEWIGLTLVYSLGRILQSLLDSNTLKTNHPSRETVKEILSQLIPEVTAQTAQNATGDLELVNQHNIVNRALRSVVLIQVGSSWGSGIIIDAKNGLVITCRHILREGGLPNIKTYDRPTTSILLHDIPDSKVYHLVEVIFSTEPDCPFDFALLKVINPKFKTSIIFSENKVVKLEENTEVLAVGHAIFGHQTSSGPCVTMGTISKVLFANDYPIMLQTTASVHGGGSGGAIISKLSGQLLGMVTCNVKDGNTLASFPHINFSIPVNVMKKLTSLSVCDEIDRRERVGRLVSSTVNRAWCLENSHSKQSKL